MESKEDEAKTVYVLGGTNFDAVVRVLIRKEKDDRVVGNSDASSKGNGQYAIEVAIPQCGNIIMVEQGFDLGSSTTEQSHSYCLGPVMDSDM